MAQTKAKAKRPRGTAPGTSGAAGGEAPAAGGEAPTAAGADTPLEVQAVLDCFPYPVMLVDDEHRIVLANRAVSDSVHLQPNALIGHFCPQAIHGTDEPFAGCPLEQAVSCGCSTECELRDEQSGVTVMSGVFETPLKTRTGRPIYLHATRDITAQKHAEERLLHSQQSLTALNRLLTLALESTPLEQLFVGVLDVIMGLPWMRLEQRGAIFMLDAHAAALRLTAQRNLSPEQQLTCAEVPLGACVCGRVAAANEATFAASSEHCHERHTAGNGTHAHVCAPISRDGRVLGVINLYLSGDQPRDDRQLEFVKAAAKVLAGAIARRAAEESRLTHQRIALSRERMARIGEFAMGVADVVRNPLHGVMGCLDVLADAVGREAGPAVLEPLELGREGLQRIARVTDRLLHLTLDRSVRLERQDVAPLLREVLALHEGVAAAREIKLWLELADPCVADVDADRFVEALANVVGNAVDASPPAGVVFVRVRPLPGAQPGLEVAVEDRGAGIPEADLARVFDPFFSTKPVGQSSGLGLCTTRRFVEEHGGTVEIRSRVGQGTEVRLRFPLRDGGAAADPPAAAAPDREPGD